MKRILISLVAMLLCAISFTAFAQLSHKVRPGDSFESIAAQYGVSLDALMAANPTYSKCYTGITLVIPSSESNSAASSVSVSNETSRPVSRTVAPAREESTAVVDQVEENNVPAVNEGASMPVKTISDVQTEQYPMTRMHYYVTYDLLLAKADFKFSMTYGFDTNIYWNRYLYAGTGLSFAMPTVRNDVAGFSVEVNSYNLQLPIKFGVSLWDGWFDLDTGPYLSCAIAGNQIYKEKGGKEEKIKFGDMEDLKRFSIGWAFNIHLCKFITVGVNASFGEGSLDDNVNSISFGIKF